MEQFFAVEQAEQAQRQLEQLAKTFYNQLAAVVDQFNSILDQQEAAIRHLYETVAKIDQSARTVETRVIALVLQSVMDTLHIRERLRIPVGTDKFSS